MKDIDVREGLDNIADAVRDAAGGEIYEIYNSDEDCDDDPAPRAVMLSAKRYGDLMETEWQYKELCK